MYDACKSLRACKLFYSWSPFTVIYYVPYKIYNSTLGPKNITVLGCSWMLIYVIVKDSEG